MTVIPGMVLLTAAVALGLLLGVFYLRGVRRPVLIGVHLLLGAAGLEQTMMLLRGTPEGEALRVGSYGLAAAGLLAFAMLSGLLAPLLGRQARHTGEAMLATHVSLGFGGFVLFLAWVGSTP